MATTEKKAPPAFKVTIDSLEEAEKLMKGLILARQNHDSEILQDLIDGTNACISVLKERA